MLKKLIDMYDMHKFKKAIDKMFDSVEYEEPETAIKWIDSKIQEGEELKKEDDDELFHEAVDIIQKELRKIRIKKNWELYKKK